MDDLNDGKQNGFLPEEMRVAEKVKSLRLEKGLSLAEVAERTGFSSALISQIENHLVSPPLGTLIKIARALEVEIGEFFGEKTKMPYIAVRRGERKKVARVASRQGVKYGYQYETLAFGLARRHMEPFLVTLEPATIRDRGAYSHEGEEFLFVLEGEVEVHLGREVEVLVPGDSIYFHSTLPHRVQCRDEGGARIIAVLYPGQKAAQD
jgi:transcriptional regulator with XRE-family HTH domain